LIQNINERKKRFPSRVQEESRE